MRITLYLLLLLFNSLFLTAQTTVSGLVTENDGAPLKGAAVSIVELQRGAITDDKGRFRFDNLGNGTVI